MAPNKDDLPPIAPQFRGVHVPVELYDLVCTGSVKPAEAWFLTLVDSLVHPKYGCYASNEYLAQMMGIDIRNIQVMVNKLKSAGLLKQVWFDGHRRHLETKWSKVGGEIGRGDENVTPEVTKTSPPFKLLKKGNQSGPASGPDASGGNGFGFVEEQAGNTTEFDTAIATRLLNATRKFLGPSHPNLKRATATKWADHVRLLRTTDKVTEARILKAIAWYTHHMGEEFVPQAYNGEKFRTKFHAIEAACERDVTSIVEITPEAAMVATRLEGLHWPKGAAQAVPAVVQRCLEGYTGWTTRCRTFVDKLRRGDLSKEYGKERQRLHRLGEHICRMLPAPCHFTQEWMTAVHERVANWPDWSGDLAPYVFRANTKRFRATGRGWADAYMSDPDKWDEFMEIMDLEVP